MGGRDKRGSYEAKNVVDDFVVGEGTMAALVADDPDTGEDETLEPPAGAQAQATMSTNTIPWIHRALTRHPMQPSAPLLHQPG